MEKTIQATDEQPQVEDQRPLEPPLVVVTGSSGLIGARAVERLAGEHRVVAMDIEAPERLPAGVAFIHCDLTDDQSVEAALATLARDHGEHIASVIHLAAYYDFSGEPSPLYEALTVEGTRRLLARLRPRFQVDQFVFTSTILVMKPAAPGEQITEDSPVEGAWDYPLSKIEAEAVIARERGNIPAVILRLAGVYDEYGHSPPIAQQIRRIHERTLESHLFPGDEERGQPFIHLDDAVAALHRTVERRFELSDYEVLLVAEPELLAYGELQDRLGQLIHGAEQWTTLRIPAPVAKAGAWIKDKLGDEETFIKPWMIDLADTHLPVSTARVEARLGWRAHNRLSATLPAIVAHLQADPEGFYAQNRLAA